MGISKGFSGFLIGGGVEWGFWGDIFGWVGFRELKGAKSRMWEDILGWGVIWVVRGLFWEKLLPVNVSWTWFSPLGNLDFCKSWSIYLICISNVSIPLWVCNKSRIGWARLDVLFSVRKGFLKFEFGASTFTALTCLGWEGVRSLASTLVADIHLGKPAEVVSFKVTSFFT